MAKATKETPKERYSKGDTVLAVYSEFIYEVEIYKCQPFCYNLEDSKILKSMTFVKDSSKRFIKDGIQFRKVVTMIAAPIEWLISNKFKHIQIT